MKISIIVIIINVWKDDDLNRPMMEYLFIPMRRFLYLEYFNPTIIEPAFFLLSLLLTFERLDCNRTRGYTVNFSEGENFNPPLIGETVEMSVIIKKKKWILMER